MARRLVLALLVLSLVWQSLPLSGFGSVLSGPAADLAHASVHWAGVSHHHHDDGGYHFDNSADSAQHLIADHSNTTATPVGGRPHIGAADPSASPPRVGTSGVPAPFIEGPLRPPRPLA